MYSIQNVNLFFGELHLLEDVSFVISPGEKLALLGRNGAGKTTLFKLISGEFKPDSGSISIPKTKKVAYLSQHFDFDESKSIMDVCLECFKDYFDIEKELVIKNGLIGELTDETELHDVLEEMHDLQLRLDSMEISNPVADSSKILKGFGFKESQFNDKISTLSGGWKMRVQMSKILLSKPDLLLLDEPDNHLDLDALIWFENYLKKYEGAVLFISHDVQFLSNLSSRILELSNRKIQDYKLNYQKFLAAKELRREKEVQSFNNQQKVIKEKERTITRFMAKATKTKMAQSMKKQLDKLERVEMESDDFNQMKISFPIVHNPGKIVVHIDKVSKSYGSNEVFKNVSLEIERGQKVAFVGQNGEGKSTLVKIIAQQLNHDNGVVQIGHNVIPNYFAQDQSDVFDESLSVLETLEHETDPEFSTRVRHTLGAFAFSGEDVDKKVSVLSGGEKSRLAMACLVSKKSNFLILDEPTNHLDIQAKALLKQAIIEYPGTLIIVSHDREILKGSVSVTYEFRDKSIIQHLGDLEYVLNKRKTDDLRAFASATIQKLEEPPPSKKSTIDYEAQKQLNRKVGYAEKEITKLEKEIKEIHDKLIDPSFFNSPESAESLKKLNELESKLGLKTREWEELISVLGI